MELTGLPKEIEKLMEYHGHLCFGVLLGYKACSYAVELVGDSKNMKVITENGGCGNDAVRALLNCTEENGRLTAQKGGNRQSWSFYNPEESEGVRLYLNPVLASQLPKDKDQALKALIEMPGSRVFLVEPWAG